MPKYIDAVTTAEAISELLGISLGDLVDIFAEIPSADVVPRSTIVEMFEELEERMETSSICSLDIEEMEGLIADAKEKYIGDAK